jgi:hypothetical protein
MASFIFNSCLRDTFRGKIDFDSDSFKVLLVTSVYRPDKDQHSRRSDIEGESDGQGYVLGGLQASVGVSMIDDILTLSLGSVKLPAATVTARYALYFVDRGAAEDDELIALIDFGGDVSSHNGEWSLSASSLRIQN